jgi:hypothetical protein
MKKELQKLFSRKVATPVQYGGKFTTVTMESLSLEDLESYISNLISNERRDIVKRLSTLKKVTKTPIPQINGDVADAIDRHDMNTIVMLWQHTLTDSYNSALVDVIAEIEFPLLTNNKK